MRALFVLAALLSAAPAFAQSTLHVRVTDAESGEALPGATVVLERDGQRGGAAADADGRVSITLVPDGPYTLAVSFVGYLEARLDVTLPLADTLAVALEHDEEELEDAVVTATRARRSIADTPTRVEAIGGEEIEEKITMDPSGIAMILNESPGIVVQQTSPVSGAAGFRIQGLDGRYTQLLRDGFPLYGGLAGGLSLLQTPPLDLAQVEVIKGPASTLYGGDAIAGLVNLVSRRPTDEGERQLLLNATSAGGFDAAGYAARRNERQGYTVLATGNVQRAYDAEDDGFTNLPATARLTVTPTYYHYGAGTLTLGLSGTLERREGGDVEAIRSDASGYTERNESRRLTALAGYERPLSETATLVLRSSGSLFERLIDITVGGDAYFDGRQFTSYTEASVDVRRGAHELIGGLDLRTDGFEDTRPVSDEVGSESTRGALDYVYASVGAFAQDTWDVTDALALEAGLRVEAHSEYGAFVLPRASVLVRPGSGFTARVGGGLGYKAPTPFLEEAEARAYVGVLGLADSVRAERSAGGTLDVTWRGIAGPVAMTLNGAVYLTRLASPLVPVETDRGLAFANADGHVLTRGADTTARLSYEDFALFLGYVYLDADRVEGDARLHLPLTARHRTYSVLVWEQHGRGRVGLEAYYTGPQDLPNGGDTPGYVVAGLLAERRFGRFRVFGNLENVLDARQSRTAPLVTGPREAPVFADVWGPTDGFIANLGVRITL